MKRKIVDEPKGARTSSGFATPRIEHSATPIEAGDRERQRLGDPQHDDEREDRREGVLILVEIQRRQEHHEERGGPEEEPGRAASAFEAFLAG